MRDERAYYEKRKTLLRTSRKAVDRLERAQLAQLRVAAKQLEKNLTVTRDNLAGLQVRALVPGQLTAFNLEVGQSLAPGERIGQIDHPTSYKILADIDEFYLGRVDVGQHAVYQADGASYTLTVSKIRPQVTSNRFQVDLVFDGKAPTKVRRGQTAQARLQLGQPTTAVLIPNAAFFNDTGGAWVFVVSGDGSQAIRRDVRLGRRNPQYIEVLGGLSPGEEIITSPYTSYLDVERLELTTRR
jgi:HlyD family secretion protein